MSDNSSANNNNQEKGGKVKSRVEAPKQKVQTFTADNDWQTSGSFLDNESSDFLSGSDPAFGDRSPGLSVQRRSTTLPATSNTPKSAPNWNFSHISTHTSPRPAIQPKLMVGPANDQYEQEADRVAQQVMRMPTPVFAPNEGGGGPVQRQEKEDLAQMKPLSMSISTLQRQEDEYLAQMKPQLIQRDSAAGFATDDTFDSNLSRQRVGGSPLPAALRADFEPKFGADFSGVRVHTNGESHQLNQSIQAKAFTTGQDVFFRQGAYQPGSRGGQELIAHELTHTIQQGASPTLRRQFDSNSIQRKQNMETAVVQRQEDELAQMKPHLIQRNSTAYIQRKLAGSLAGINQNYLSKFKEQYNQLASFKTRAAVLKFLMETNSVIESDTDLQKQIPNALANLDMADSPQVTPPEPLAGATKQERDQAIPEPKQSRATQETTTPDVTTTQPRPTTTSPKARTSQGSESGGDESPQTTHKGVGAGGKQIIVNYIWIGPGKISPLYLFNIYSWLALGHEVNIYTHHTTPEIKHTKTSLGLQDEDEVGIKHIVDELDIHKVSRIPEQQTMNSPREILISWLTRMETGQHEITQNLSYNIGDLTKTYIGATCRGIVLDLKIGPSVQLQAYAEAMHRYFISFTRGLNTATRPENQSMGTMADGEIGTRLRQTYGNRFASAMNAQEQMSGKTLAESPDDTHYDKFTGWHGAGWQAVGKEALNTEKHRPDRKEDTNKAYSAGVGDPGSFAHGPFQNFKRSDDQMNRATDPTDPKQQKNMAVTTIEQLNDAAGGIKKYIDKAAAISTNDNMWADLQKSYDFQKRWGKGEHGKQIWIKAGKPDPKDWY